MRKKSDQKWENLNIYTLMGTFKNFNKNETHTNEFVRTDRVKGQLEV